MSEFPFESSPLVLPEVGSPLVSVTWLDIEGIATWSTTTEVVEHRRLAMSRCVYTVGWLLYSDDESVVVSSTIRPDISLEGPRTHQFSDVTVIPTGAVVAIDLLLRS